MVYTVSLLQPTMQTHHHLEIIMSGHIRLSADIEHALTQHGLYGTWQKMWSLTVWGFYTLPESALQKQN